MSAFSGILRFDPRQPASSRELAFLGGGIDRFGPDGGDEYRSGPVGMVYRAFHTTPESHRAIQPFRHDGIVLTWDGRLDNRQEIREELGVGDTDTELVAAAYRRWGNGCFARLIGDWALALWDERVGNLTLARDFIGVRRLFYRTDHDGFAWCTELEPLVLSLLDPLRMNLDFLAGSLYGCVPLESTPYREIRAVKPGSCAVLHPGGTTSLHRSWSIDPDRTIRYGSDAEYEEHFRHLLAQSVRRRLRAERPVLAELSGGIDSSSIVCMADSICRKETGPPVETLSYFNPEEPSGDERLFFTTIEQTRNRSGHHISVTEVGGDAVAPLPASVFTALPGRFERSMRWAALIGDVHERVGSRVLLSGLGGDELLGGVQYEAPELADHLISGHLMAFGRALYGWSVSRRKTVWDLLWDTQQLIETRRQPEKLIAGTHKSNGWLLLDPPSHAQSISTFAPWRNLSPRQRVLEGVRYTLAGQLTLTEALLAGSWEYRYPLLDRDLFEFIAAIPRNQVVRAGHRRHLVRRALRDLVPPEVLFRRSKWFGYRSTVIDLQSNSIDRMFEQPWHSDGKILDLTRFRARLEELRQGSSGEGLMLLKAIAVEQWLRAQAERKTVAF